MIVGQELGEIGGEVKLLNHINTDDIERENWRKVQDGKGFMYENG